MPSSSGSAMMLAKLSGRPTSTLGRQGQQPRQEQRRQDQRHVADAPQHQRRAARRWRRWRSCRRGRRRASPCAPIPGWSPACRWRRARCSAPRRRSGAAPRCRRCRPWGRPRCAPGRPATPSRSLSSAGSVSSVTGCACEREAQIADAMIDAGGEVGVERRQDPQRRAPGPRRASAPVARQSCCPSPPLSSRRRCNARSRRESRRRSGGGFTVAGESVGPSSVAASWRIASFSS